ncbi:28S ribosomal protein S18b, mitochondrial [Osmia bicornis bicornis]|uniref:28S ribosomal protein S18b, mitochondrial n=1 Tax=Osmia bicornis bicornis TaxID=1437191 RepID=UPI0010F56718|nr:28S ribosomal protein S18b, mitochondrial [Osmia bicornis bicornis]
MSLILNKLFLAGSVWRTTLNAKVTPVKFVHSTFVRFDEEVEGTEQAKKIDPSKDRSKIIPVETSIKYLESSAYKTTYGNDPVWKPYRRNFKGQFAPKKTRKMCIRNGVISTGSPCPICRDEYLVLDYRNIELLKQFVSQYTGETLDPSCTGLCQRAHKDLLVALMKAKEYGLLIHDVPYRYYDYLEWKS